MSPLYMHFLLRQQLSSVITFSYGSTCHDHKVTIMCIAVTFWPFVVTFGTTICQISCSAIRKLWIPS